MHILYLHQYFATRDGAGGTRSYEFARHLIAAGHRVTMVTAPRQAGGIKAVRKQTVDGIDVLTLGGFYSNHLSGWERGREFLRFTLQACRLKRAELASPPDVVIASSTPLTVGIPGAMLAKRYGVPFVFEVRDLWPQALIELGALRNPIAIWFARRLERWSYRRANKIIALSPGMAHGVWNADHSADQRKLTIIPNASDTDLFTPEARDRTLLSRWHTENEFVAIHAGSMGAANGLDYLVDAANDLKQRNVDNIRIVICGDGSTRPQLEQRVHDLDLTNVIFAGQIPRRELGPLVASCDVAITCFKDLPILGTNSPNKLFDGLAAGVPNIVNARGWTRPLVENADAGAFVDPAEPAQLADALIALRDDPALRARQGNNARQLACSTFDRTVLADRFRNLLETVVADPERPLIDPSQAAQRDLPEAATQRDRLRIAMVDPAAYSLPYDSALCTALAQRGHDVTLYTTRFAHGAMPAPNGYRVSEWFYRRRIPLLPRRYTRGLQHPFDIGALGRHLARVRPDVLHIQWSVLDGHDAAAWTRIGRKLGIPVVYTAHNAQPREGTGESLAAQHLKRFDAVVAHSECGIEALETMLPAERLWQIPHGVLDRYLDAPEPAAPPVSLDPDAPVVALPGLLRPYKGVDILLQAWPEVRKRVPNAQLIIAGRPMGIELPQTPPAGVSLLPHFLDDPEFAWVLRRASVVCLPYTAVDLSGVLFSAMAMERPIVASNIGGFAELAGMGVELVPPANAPALAAALAELLLDSDRRAALAREAAAATRNVFAWAPIAATYERRYCELTGIDLGPQRAKLAVAASSAAHRSEVRA